MSSNEFPARRGSDVDQESAAIRTFQQLVVGFPHLKPTFYRILLVNGFDLVRGLQHQNFEVFGGAPLTPAHFTTIAGLLDHWVLASRGLHWPIGYPDSDGSSYTSGDVATDYSGSASSAAPHLAPSEAQGTGGSVASGGKRPSGSVEF
jgi:hypothetical protein